MEDRLNVEMEVRGVIRQQAEKCLITHLEIPPQRHGLKIPGDKKLLTLVKDGIPRDPEDLHKCLDLHFPIIPI